MEPFCPVFTRTYDPLRAGSIDGTDEYPHDKGIVRAMNAVYKPNKFVKGQPEYTVFVGRLHPNTTEETLRSSLREFGKINRVRLIKDIVTGFSKCYGFVEFTNKYDAEDACRKGHRMIIDDHEILIDSEKERVLKGWVPRRLGGGIGGKRESGQLRFGGKDRSFKKPICYSENIERVDEKREKDQGIRDTRRDRSYSRKDERGDDSRSRKDERSDDSRSSRDDRRKRYKR